MNPDEVLNQQDGILYMDSSWNKSTTPKTGYIAVKVQTKSYADGRIIRTALNDDGSVLGQIDTTYNPDQQKTFKDSQPPGGLTTRAVNGQQMGWNPRTGQYDIPQGTAAPQASTEDPATARNNALLQQQRERNAALPAGQDPRYETDAERAARAQAMIDKQGAPKPNPQTTTIGGVTYERGADGTWKPAQGLPSDPTKAVPPPKYSEVKQDPTTGQWFGFTPQGAWEGIAGGPTGPNAPTTPTPASATGWQVDYSKPDGGLFDRRTAVQGMLTSGVFGDPASAAAQLKANELLKQDLAYATTALNNVSNIQQGEQANTAQQISQRGQDVTQADTRTNAATSIFNTGVSELMKLMPYLPKGSHLAGAAIDALLQRAYDFQVKMGGQNTPDTVQPGPYTARTAQIFQPSAAMSAPLQGSPGIPARPPVSDAGTGLPASTIVQPHELPKAAPLSSFIPPPTGAPVSATGTPAAAAGLSAPAVAPVPPTSEQPRDTTGPGYPGQGGAPPYLPPAPETTPAPYVPPPAPADPTSPYVPGMTGPQPGELPSLPVPAGTGSVTQAPMASPDQLSALQNSPYFQAFMAQQAQAPQQDPNQPTTLGLATQLGFSPSAIAQVFGQQG